MASFQSIACSFTILKSGHANSTGIRERQINIPDVSTIPFIYDTRFAELINTNVPPDTSDLHFLNTSLENARSISATINKGIITLRRALEEMESVNTNILTTITQHQAILNPVRSIPDDILLTIFQWCSYADTPRLDSLSSCHAPWTLSHVSRRWRALAISYPCLWSKVKIIHRALETSIPHERDKMSFKLNLYLRRSAECDLFVNLAARNASFPNEYFRLLLLTANRWKTLFFSVYDSAVPLRLARCSFERLTKLTFSVSPNVPAGRRCAWHMPNIRNLSFSGSILDTLDLPWERVTSYTCDGNGLCHLPKLSALENISLTIISFNVTFWSGVSLPLTLPNIHSVSIRQYFSHGDDIEKLSDFLLLPSLTTLEITMMRRGWKFPRFNGSLECHLQNLSIIIWNSTHGPAGASPSEKLALRSFLAKCTSVTALYLEMHTAEEFILGALEDEIALPNLMSLRVGVRSMWDHPELVLKLVELRCEGVNVAPLTELRIVEGENTWKPEERWRQSYWVQKRLQRWYAVCSKINVLTVYANNF